MRVLDEFDEPFAGSDIDEPFAGADVTFDIEAGSGSLSPSTNTSVEGGWVNTTYEAVDADAGIDAEVSVTANDTGVSTTVPFDVTANPTTFTNETVEPTVPEPNESTEVALRVRDESGSPLPDAEVELNVTEGNSALDDVPAESNPDGWVNASYTPVGEDANTTVEIEFTANETEANRRISFDVSERAADSFNQTFVDPPEIDPVDAPQRSNETTVAVQVLDQVDDELGDAPVNFSVVEGAGNLNTTSTNSSTNGWANVTYNASRDDADQTIEIEVDAVDRAANATIPFDVSANADKFTNETVEPAIPEPNESTNVAIQVFDESETPLSEAAVELNVTQGNSTLEAVPSESDGKGWINASYTPVGDDANTTVEIEVTANETVANRTISFDVSERAAGSFNRTFADPDPIDPINTTTKHNETTIAVQVLDQVDEELENTSVDFTVVDGTGEGVLDTTTTNSSTNGWANVTYSADRDDANQTVEIKVDAVDRAANATIAFDVSANADSIDKITADPETVDPGDTSTINATVRDEADRNLSGADVTFSTSGSEAITPIENTSLADGTVTAEYTPGEGDANGTVGIEIDAVETNATASTVIAVNRLRANAFRNETVDPDPADPGDTVMVSAEVVDSLEQAIEDEDVDFETDGNGTLNTLATTSQPNGTVEAEYTVDKTDADRTVAFTITANETEANTTIELAVDELAVDELVNVTSTPAEIDPVDDGDDEDDEEDRDNKTALSVRALDQVGDPLGGQPIEYTITHGNGTLDSGLDSEIVTSNGDGWANTTYEAVGDDANTTVDIDINATGTDAKTNVTVDVGANADAIADVDIPNEVDPGDSVPVSLVVVDESGDPFSGGEINFGLFDDTDSALDPSGVVSDAGGIVNTTLLVADEDAGDQAEFTVSGEYISEIIGTSVTKNADAFNDVTVDRELVAPNGTATISAEVLDERGDTLEGANVTFEADGAGAVTPGSTTSDSDGQLSTSYEPARPDADSNVTVTIAANDTDAKRNVTVQVDELEAVAVTNASSTPDVIEPDETSTINATVRDQFDEPLAGETVSFETDAPGTLTAENGTSGPNGTVEATFTAAAENATINITAERTGASTNTTVRVLDLEPTAFTETDATPDEITADNETILSARVLDQLGEPFEDVNVSVDTNGNGTLGADNVTSDADGIINTTYTAVESDVDRTVGITLESVNGTANTTVEFDVRPTPQGFAHLTAEPKTVEPGEPATISATVVDEHDLPLEGADVAFDHNGSASLDPTVNTSAADGTVETSYTPLDETNGTVTLTAVETGVSSTIEINVTDLEPRSITDVRADPGTVEPGDNATISATVRDQLGDPFAGANVSFSHGGNGTLSVANDSSGPSGDVETVYRSTSGDAESTVEIELTDAEFGLEANGTVSVGTEPQPPSSGSSGSTETRIIVEEDDATDRTTSGDETVDIRGSASSIRVENPPENEPVGLNEETTGLSSLSQAEHTSLDSVTITTSDSESYRLESTSYDYTTVQLDGRSSATETESTDTEPATGTATGTDTDAESETVIEEFADFEQQNQRIPIGYLQVDTTAAPESVSAVVFEFSVEKAHLADQSVEPSEVALYRKDGDEWGPIETTRIDDTESHYRFESHSQGLSVFPIGTERRPVAVTDTTLNSSQVAPGETASVSVELENRGLLENTSEVRLSANGETVDTSTVRLESGASTTAELTFTPASTGEYDLAVGDREVGTLTAESPPPVGGIESVREALGDNNGWTVVGVFGLLAVVFVVARRW